MNTFNEDGDEDVKMLVSSYVVCLLWPSLSFAIAHDVQKFSQTLSLHVHVCKNYCWHSSRLLRGQAFSLPVEI